MKKTEQSSMWDKKSDQWFNLHITEIHETEDRMG